MIFIEVTVAEVNRKTAININHIVRYGPAVRQGQDQARGSFLVLTAPSGEKGSYFLQVTEKPGDIEELLAKASARVIR